MRAKRFGAPADAWRDAIAGGYERGDHEDDGRGWFDYDLDVVADLDPEEEARGAFRAEFARLGEHGQLAVRLDAVTTADRPEPTDARYFVGVTAEGGLLEVGFDLDIGDAGGPAVETLEVAVRWLSSGAGVANVRATDGDLGGDELLAIECWDRRASRTHLAYVRQPAGDDGRPEGNADACVFDDWQGPALAPMGDEMRE